MKQPPPDPDDNDQTTAAGRSPHLPVSNDQSMPENRDAGRHPRTSFPTSTSWRRPVGVAAGTWAYTRQGSIAEHYDAFVAQTPLCQLDEQLVAEVFPPPSSATAGPPAASDSEEKNCRPGTKKSWILDLGCGTGRTAEQLSRLGYGVLAVDLSAPMLHQLQRRGLEGVLPIQANLVQLDGLGDHIADGAVCLFSTFGMIQGRSNRRAMLGHTRRIVRRGGRLLLHVHHRYASFAQRGGGRLLWRSWRDSWRRDREFGDAVYPYRGLDNMFLHRFSCREIVNDLVASGWYLEQVLRISLDGREILPRSLAARCRIAGGFFLVATAGPVETG